MTDTNGVADLYRPHELDPGVSLLIQEIRRSNDSLRGEMVGAQRETTAAIGGLSDELRKQAPGRLSFYLSTAVVLLALVSVFGLLASKGVDVATVAHAVTAVAPDVPQNGPTSPVGTPAAPTPPATPLSAPAGTDGP